MSRVLGSDPRQGYNQTRPSQSQWFKNLATDPEDGLGSTQHAQAVELSLSLRSRFLPYSQTAHTTTEEKHQVFVDRELH
jgi:hypothetical protein